MYFHARKYKFKVSYSIDVMQLAIYCAELLISSSFMICILSSVSIYKLENGKISSIII